MAIIGTYSAIMKILYTVSDGYIFNPAPAERLSDKELELIATGVWGLIDVASDALMDGRYIVLDGELTLLPEDQWPEKQIEEGQ